METRTSALTHRIRIWMKNAFDVMHLRFRAFGPLHQTEKRVAQ